MFGKLVKAEVILAWRKNLLSQGGRPVDLDWLLNLGAGLRSADLQRLYLYPKSFIEIDKSLEELEVFWHKHLNEAIPLQHLIGKCPWRDFELEVSREVLIPRQETELLIDFALQKFDFDSKGVWVDLGTGSGALTVALSRSLKRWEGHSVDCSSSALAMAKKNLSRLSPEAKVKFYLGNWFQPISFLEETIDLVIANPPYIPTSIINTLEPVVRDHEPHLALIGGEDGLDCCREIISGAIKNLISGGWLFLEHNYDQSEKVLKIMQDYGFDGVTFDKDLEGVRRFASGSKPM